MQPTYRSIFISDVHLGAKSCKAKELNDFLKHNSCRTLYLVGDITIGLGPQLKLLQAIIKTQRRSLVKKLRKHWADTKPDLVISLIPNFNRAIGDSIDGRFLTVITDMADFPPHFWIEPKAENQHVVCGTEHAVLQAREAGLPVDRIHRVQGMIMRPAFYETMAMPRDEVEEPVGLVMFGGIGSKDMVPIAKQLNKRKLILVCGKNEKLRQKLIGLGTPDHQIIGFTQDVPLLMSKCDYFIGKPGPGSLSEAFQMQLPVIVPLNAFTMPQERWNAEYVRRERAGLIVKNFNKIDAAVAELLEKLDELKRNVVLIQNTALFDVPKVIAGLLNTVAA